jgi:gamma-glutamyl-gamma-aminobutyrate hydrolase PuuD
VVYLAPPKSEAELGYYVTWLSKTDHSITILRNVEDLNGPLILAGGADIGKNPERDAFEYSLIHKALENGWPILGVCRGMQIVNAYFGGDVEDLLVEDNHSSSRDFIMENNVARKKSIYHEVWDEDHNHFRVNSRHHQHCLKIPRPLRPIMWSWDGIVEAIYGPKILLVQWHPERSEVYGSMASEWPLMWLKEHL